jgi:diguanylate cyclase (GGDEF)-like protein
MLRDSLTGLPNRTAFNERVEAALEDPGFQPGSHAVLVVDMRRFSRVNECVGALAGDELLIAFARRLFSALRAHDLLARTGGDEFGILLRLERPRGRPPGGRADPSRSGFALPAFRARDQGRLRGRLRAA